MYYVRKKIEVAMAHHLNLNYKSKCSNLHGHNAEITIYCRSEVLDENGMVVDFSKVKEIIYSLLDHKYINEIVTFNPTAENLAMWICKQIPNCYKVLFQESDNNVAAYAIDNDNTI